MMHFGPGRFVVHNRSCRVKRVKELSKAVLSRTCIARFHFLCSRAQNTKLWYKRSPSLLRPPCWDKLDALRLVSTQHVVSCRDKCNVGFYNAVVLELVLQIVPSDGKTELNRPAFNVIVHNQRHAREFAEYFFRICQGRFCFSQPASAHPQTH